MPLQARIAEPQAIHVARRSMATSIAAFPMRGGSDSGSEASANPYSAAGPVRTQLPEANQPSDAFPIWFAVLMASSCLAEGNGENHTVRWDCISGRAIYTNRGGDAERIEPLGVSLRGGETLAVYWMPGDTEYTVEVYGQNERCA